MIGIYKYQNKINGHCYIGQSIDLEKRKQDHKSVAFNKNANDYNSQFHQAVRKYGGFDAFDYEIVATLLPEEYSKETLNSLERFFVKYYDSYHNGYNATPGGDGSGMIGKSGSNNGRALLNEVEVEYIRECYNNHIPFRAVYAEFKDKISKRGLQKVWYFENWKNIHPEYNNAENKYWHSHQAKANAPEIAANNTRAFTKEQVLQMRQDYDNGMSPKQVWLKYAPDKAWSTIYNIVTRQTYKDIE
jgi:group I intron endonuclease